MEKWNPNGKMECMRAKGKIAKNFIDLMINLLP
jgi:hypothetical protein